MIFGTSVCKRRLRRSTLVCGVCLALFAGTGLAHAVVLGDERWLLLGLPVLVLVRRHDWLALLVLVAVGFSVGWWRGSMVQRQLEPYAQLAKRSVIVVGQASEDGVYGSRSQLSFGLQRVSLVAPRQLSLPGSVSVSGFGAPIVYRGDWVQVSGKLGPPYGGAQAEIGFARLKVLRHAPSVIDTVRRRFAAGLQSALPEPAASFGLGLLIGQRSTLPKGTSQMLLAVGLTHLIAVSGYNLTIIVNAVRRLCGQRSKFQTAAACVLLVATFLMVTGNNPAIVRAAIISTLSILAWYYGRRIQPMVLLLVAAAITVLANPLYLWGNGSWYLSFLAFFGVVVVAPLVTRRVWGGREPGVLLAILIESLCAEAMTLPYVLHTFGQMSLVGLPANVLVAVVVPLAMLLCLVAGLAGMWVPPVAGWLAWPAKLALGYMLSAAGLLSRIPHSFLEHIDFGLVPMVASYAVVLAVIFILQRKNGIVTEKIAGADSERTQQMVDD